MRAPGDEGPVTIALTGVGSYAIDLDLASLLSMPLRDMYVVLDRAVGTESLGPLGELLAPLDRQEIWASGVTYQRSREARFAESKSADVYARVYEADRPELFFKSDAWRVPAPGMPLRIRSDSGWDVPEPELALVFNAHRELVGYMVGNDMSSRAIEAENPLYLPQAKVFDDCLGLSEMIALARDVPDPQQLIIAMTITRDRAVAFEGQVAISKMHRSFDDLREYLFRELSFPHGVVLLTGTGLVPPESFTLAPGDEVTISVDGVGELRHTVYRREREPATR